MLALSRILGSGPSASASQARYQDLDDEWLKDTFGGYVSATGLHVSTEDALTVPGIAACMQVLEDDLAKVPIQLFRKQSKNRRVPAEDHRLYRLLKESPAPWLSSYNWRRAIIHNALASGNGHSRVWRSAEGNVERITPLRHGSTVMRWQKDGEPFFDVGDDRGLSWHDVIHMPYRSSTDRGVNNGIAGISPIDQHRETIALAVAAERFAARFFANGARPSVVLEMDKKFPNDSAARRVRASFERVYGGVDSAFKVAILELGIKLKEFSTNPADSQLIETRKEQAVQCCTMFGVPPHKVGILDRATNNNIEHQGIDYVTGPLSSLAESLQSSIEIACLSLDEREEYYVEVNLDGLMRGDLASRYRAYSIGRQWGWLSADDVRSRENMDDLPGNQGKTYLMPMNMTPTDKNTAEEDDGAGDKKRPAKPSRNVVRPSAEEIGRFGVTSN